MKTTDQRIASKQEKELVNIITFLLLLRIAVKEVDVDLRDEDPRIIDVGKWLQNHFHHHGVRIGPADHHHSK